MPFAETVESKTILISDKTRLVLAILANAARKIIQNNSDNNNTNSINAEILPGHTIVASGAGSGLKKFFGDLFGQDWADKTSVFEEITVKLDAQARILLNSYKHFLNKTLLEQGYSIEDTEVPQIKEPFLLVSFILRRLVTLALSYDCEIKRDGENLINIIKEFVKNINCNYLKLNKKNEVSPFIRTLSTEHERWINNLQNMVQTVKALHANATVISDLLSKVSELKYRIMCHIVAHLDPKKTSAHLSNNWIETTLNHCENQMLSFYLQQVSKKIDNLKTGQITKIEKLISARFEISNYKKQKYLLKICGNPHLFELYLALARTDAVLQMVSQIDMLITTTGWVSIITGVLNLEIIAKKIDDHFKYCRHLLKIPRDSSLFKEPIGIAFLELGITSIDQLEVLSSQSIKKVVQLQDPDLVKQLRELIANSINDLNELQERMTCSPLVAIEQDSVGLKLEKVFDAKKTLDQSHLNMLTNHKQTEDVDNLMHSKHASLRVSINKRPSQFFSSILLKQAVKETKYVTLDGDNIHINKTFPISANRVVGVGKPPGMNNYQIKIWDSKTGKCLESLDGHRAPILYMVEISDNQLVMGSEDGKLIVWDLNNYSVIKILHEHTGSITCLYYSERLNSLFSASKDKTLLKWDINEWHCITLRGHNNYIYTMIELNNKNIVTAGYNSGYFGGTNIHVWDIDKRSLINKFSHGDSGIHQLLIVDENRFISLTYNNCNKTYGSRLWDINLTAFIGNMSICTEDLMEFLNYYKNLKSGWFIDHTKSNTIKIWQFNENSNEDILAINNNNDFDSGSEQIEDENIITEHKSFIR